MRLSLILSGPYSHDIYLRKHGETLIPVMNKLRKVLINAETGQVGTSTYMSDNPTYQDLAGTAAHFSY